MRIFSLWTRQQNQQNQQNQVFSCASCLLLCIAISLLCFVKAAAKQKVRNLHIENVSERVSDFFLPSQNVTNKEQIVNYSDQQLKTALELLFPNALRFTRSQYIATESPPSTKRRLESANAACECMLSLK